MTVALALGASLVYGVADFLGGFAARRAPVLTVCLASQVVGLAGLLVLAPSLPGTPRFDDLAWGAAGGVAGGIGIVLLYRGLATGIASVVAPVTAVCAILVPVVIGLALGERPGPVAFGGMALAAIAVALLSGWDPFARGSAARPADPIAGAPRRTGLGIAIASGVLLGAFLACMDQPRPGSGMWPLVAARSVSTLGFAAACLIARKPLVPARGALAICFWTGALDVLANVLYVAAVQPGPLGITATLASFYPASTVALAYVVLRERLGRVQRVGLALAFVAIVLVTLPGR